MVGPDCPLSVVLVALGHSTLGRARVPALVMGCRREGGDKGHTSHSSLHLSLRGHQLTSTRPACSQDRDTRTHHDGHTGEQHSREKLPDPGGGGGCKGEVTVTLSTWTPRDTVQDQTPGLGKDPEQGPVIT